MKEADRIIKRDVIKLAIEWKYNNNELSSIINIYRYYVYYLNQFFALLNVLDKDKDLRSYCLDFSKMKKFFNLEPGSDLLKATKIIVDNINSKKYGDLESKKYYNT